MPSVGRTPKFYLRQEKVPHYMDERMYLVATNKKFEGAYEFDSTELSDKVKDKVKRGKLYEIVIHPDDRTSDMYIRFIEDKFYDDDGVLVDYERFYELSPNKKFLYEFEFEPCLNADRMISKIMTKPNKIHGLEVKEVK